ncbi:UNVERIFIED_CONTAM: hypothetical protein HDU68_000881 [Siphonaria sp. JEL0065]|nr:hypothetical protein HDU68_000881 [Siphonaria sp. JEL0065]
MGTAISAPVTTVVGLSGLSATIYLYFIRKGPVFSAKYKFFGVNPPPKPKVVGFTAKGFESLEPLLTQAFGEGNDLGCQFALYVKGELKVDIATGFTDRTFKVPYAQDTLQLVFSSSKLVTSAIIAHLVNTGRMSFDDKISKYWPEFAQGGKQDVTVAQFLAHRGGVAFLDPERVPTPEELVDLDLLANKIAGQPHNFDGKEVSAYHAVSRGWFLNELVRRVTNGKTIRDIAYNEITPILNRNNTGVPYEINFGIPDTPTNTQQATVSSRLALLDGYSPIQKMFFVIVPEFILRWFGLLPVPRTLINAYLHKNTPQHMSLFKSGPDFTGREAEFPWNYNDPTLLRSQSPSFCCLTNARSLARLAELLRKSEFSETEGLLSPSVFRESFTELGVQHDLVMAKPACFIQLGVGVVRDGFGVSGERAGGELEWVGWAGAGGSIVYINRDYGVSIAYTNNFCHLQSVGDERTWRLFEELVRIIKRDDPKGFEKVQKANAFITIAGGEE